MGFDSGPSGLSLQKPLGKRASWAPPLFPSEREAPCGVRSLIRRSRLSAESVAGDFGVSVHHKFVTM